MAKGRTYNRDARGRFAGGSGGGKKPKTAAGRASANLRAAEKALKRNPGDRKATKRMATAIEAQLTYMERGTGRKGAAKPGPKGKATRKSAASAIKATGGKPKATAPASKVRPTGTKLKKAPRSVVRQTNAKLVSKVPRSKIKRAGAKLPKAKKRRIGKLIKDRNRLAREINNDLKSITNSLRKIKGYGQSMERRDARMALSSSKFDQEMARQGKMIRPARRAVERRMQRAFNVQNGRNPRIGSKALFVYQPQLRQLSDFGNARKPFRRKPMTEKQAAAAKKKRDAAASARLMKALDADVKAAAKAKPKPRAKAKPKPAASKPTRRRKP